MRSMQFFGGIRASGRIIHDSHALRTEQMPSVVKPTRSVKPNAVSLGAPATNFTAADLLKISIGNRC